MDEIAEFTTPVAPDLKLYADGAVAIGPMRFDRDAVIPTGTTLGPWAVTKSVSAGGLTITLEHGGGAFRLNFANGQWHSAEVPVSQTVCSCESPADIDAAFRQLIASEREQVVPDLEWHALAWNRCPKENEEVQTFDLPGNTAYITPDGLLTLFRNGDVRLGNVVYRSDAPIGCERAGPCRVRRGDDGVLVIDQMEDETKIAETYYYRHGVDYRNELRWFQGTPAVGGDSWHPADAKAMKELRGTMGFEVGLVTVLSAPVAVLLCLLLLAAYRNLPVIPGILAVVVGAVVGVRVVIANAPYLVMGGALSQFLEYYTGRTCDFALMGPNGGGAVKEGQTTWRSDVLRKFRNPERAADEWNQARAKYLKILGKLSWPLFLAAALGVGGFELTKQPASVPSPPVAK